MKKQSYMEVLQIFMYKRLISIVFLANSYDNEKLLWKLQSGLYKTVRIMANANPLTPSILTTDFSFLIIANGLL